jgi:two-component system sensor histidine kinase ResE
MINLTDNAIKFSPTGGTVTLRARANGKQVVCTVQDEGSGVLPQDAPHIFERFYKADKAHTVGKGTGLGLAISRKIMEKHGQSIRLVSGDHGAVFEITLESARKGTQEA